MMRMFYIIEYIIDRFFTVTEHSQYTGGTKELSLKFSFSYVLYTFGILHSYLLPY